MGSFASDFFHLTLCFEVHPVETNRQFVHFSRCIIFQPEVYLRDDAGWFYNER